MHPGVSREFKGGDRMGTICIPFCLQTDFISVPTEVRGKMYKCFGVIKTKLRVRRHTIVILS